MPMRHTIRPAAVLVALFLALPAAAQQVVSGGPGFDYQADVTQPWGEPQSRIVVFERLSQPGLSGDLLVTRSDDDGATWSKPLTAIGTAANERHAALVQTGAQQYQLYHLSDASGAFRIHRASSSDGQSFTAHGALDLGWPGGGEINPHVIRQADGTLIMTYHRLSGPAYIARSMDHGLTWDQERIQISPANAALPRLTHRQSDGLYLLVYQTNPGDNQLQLWVRTSHDPGLWSTPPQPLIIDGNNHDALPLVLPDGRFIVFWARAAGNFQIFSIESTDGVSWSDPVQRVNRPGLANVQPHALALQGGVLDLYWGAETISGDYDILRLPIGLDHRFRDRFEPTPP